jgi:hypothetical protein
MRKRILSSALVGLCSGFYCWLLLVHFRLGAADFGAAISAARAILHHQNPYAAKLQLYPVPAALFGLPFVALKPAVAGGIFFGISSALLAFGLLRSGYVYLLIFLAYPYWAAAITAQWSPLLMASSFFPIFMPFVLAKPQIGLPIALTHFKWHGFAICIAILLLSILLMPNWPAQWKAHFGEYQYFIPIFVLPGPLLVLALWRYKDRDAWFFVLAALMPQRWFYDAFILWLIPKTRREIVWTIFFSWGAGIVRWYWTPNSSAQVGRWVVFFFYLPMLIVIIMRRNAERVPKFWN